MKHAIAILLDIKVKRYNIPESIKPHITLVYPFESINQQEIEKHTKDSIKDIEPFTITLNGLQKSAKEYYLYLLVEKGKKYIIDLYKKLNSGLLKNLKNLDMPRYIPHLTLGVFKSKQDLDNALNELKSANLKFETKVDSIQLLTFNRDDSIESVQVFVLINEIYHLSIGKIPQKL